MDLRSVSYDEWLNCIFDHPASANGLTSDAWYWAQDLEIISDPIRQVEFLTRLCASPGVLIERYDLAQINQGLWFTFSAGGADHTYELLWSDSVPWELRARCIATIPNLWPALFELVDAGTMDFMLWDSLAYGYDCGNRKPGDDPEDHRVQEAMRSALLQQLTSDSPETQSAALHGLGHLCHPDVHDDIERFLGRFGLEEDVRAYAGRVLAGEIQ